MQLHDLKRKHPNKAKRTRVGRGGKRGTTSGRGTKGQKSRSGHRIRPAIRDYIQRLPKLRGYNNKPLSDKPAIINVDDLQKLSATVINREALLAARLIKSVDKTVKVLGDGELKRKVSVEGLQVSAGAKKKIEAAGGAVKV